jgi:hypothetical protein
MSYRVLLIDPEGTVQAIDDWAWRRDPQTGRSTPQWALRARPERHEGLGFASLDDAEQAVQHLAAARDAAGKPIYRLFRIDEGRFPTMLERWDRAVQDEILEEGQARPWLRGMRGPRGPLVPE